MIALQVFGQNVTEYPGTGSMGNHTFEVLLMLVGSFLLGWFLHHLTHCLRLKARIEDLEGDLRSTKAKLKSAEELQDGYKLRLDRLKSDNDALYAQVKSLEAQQANMKSSTSSVSGTKVTVKEPTVEETATIVASSSLADTSASSSGSAFDADGAKKIFGKKVKEDDLKIIEGIGPKTSDLLQGSSINTWRQLANTSIPSLQGILTDGGDRFQLLNPGTWPKQAKLAADGEWAKLKKYQDRLIGGVEPDQISSGTKAKPATKAVKPEPVFDGAKAKEIFGKKIKENDLKIVEGIGPKISDILNKNGIKTWRALATSTPKQIKGFLEAEGDRYRIHNPGTWPKQAKMAADGKWKKLLEYQDRLIGGVEPS